MGILRKMFYTDYICQMKIINNMNEKIDLTKILKDCPKGTKFYSPICGEVYFKEIGSDEKYIIVTKKSVYKYKFTEKGFCYADEGEECLLFPSKDQRDWSKFTAPWYKAEKFDPKTLQPFDRVLAASMADGRWVCDFFSHIGESIRDSGRLYVGTGFGAYDRMIPYNEETKHLVGTTDEAPEYYKHWED